MKKFLKIIFLLLFIIFVLAIYNYNSSKYILNKTWKYSGGFPSGDIVQCEIANGKLKLKGPNSADIAFCFNRYLIVKNKENGKYGYYILKSG